MNKRSSAAYLALFVGLSVTLAGCGYLNEVRAMKAFKDGNKAYAASDWRVAVNKYQEAANYLAQFVAKAPDTDPYKDDAKGILENLKEQANVKPVATPTRRTRRN